MKRRKDDWRGLIHCDVGAFFITATVDIPVIQAKALRLRNNVLLNGFGVSFVTGVFEAMTSVAFSASGMDWLPLPSFINFLTPRTDHAVVSSVNRKPPMITVNTLRTSHTFPSPFAKGRVIKLGTKNTGSHFANSIAPGFNTRYTPSPHFSFIAFRNIMEEKRAPQPASEEGNGIEYFRNKDLNCMSRKIRIVVASIVRFFPGDFGGEETVAAVAERAVYFLT
mmetsp:Transcript_8995/g.20290  ORF Transcript_8995/g.20290 Transcript_8995/m.20290 type:complete len:223 (+) Transcript_8995:827-1495(+)